MHLHCSLSFLFSLAGAQLSELNLLTNLIAIYGEATLNTDMLIDLTRTMFNLSMSFFTPFQTCGPHLCHEEEEQHSTFVCDMLPWTIAQCLQQEMTGWGRVYACILASLVCLYACIVVV
jgi:hypothetical protein